MGKYSLDERFAVLVSLFGLIKQWKIMIFQLWLHLRFFFAFEGRKKSEMFNEETLMQVQFAASKFYASRVNIL